MNPSSADIMKAYYTYKAFKGLDENCAEYMGGDKYAKDAMEMVCYAENVIGGKAI